jgi:hypothetical protein
MDGERKDASVSIPVINFVDREIEKERLLTLESMARLREVLQGRFESVDKAQTIAYTELQRRLDMLNHAHDEMVRDKAHFQPRELSDAEHREYTTWRDLVNSQLSQHVGRMATWGTVLTLIIIAIQVLLHFWK